MTDLCLTCSKVFSTKGNLKTHVKTVHEKQKNYTCDRCDKSFTQNHSLQTHVKTVHEKQRNYNCDYCDKSFTQNITLQTHVERIHKNPKPKSMSRLEQKASEILLNYNIMFQREVTFNDLLGFNGGHLRFDFVIPTSFENSSPYLMIELDGQQHERPITFGNQTDDQAIENFEILQQHDQIKTYIALKMDILY